MELILIRHGLPEHIESSDGSPADPPLAPEGLGQATRLATWLEPESIDRLYASPMNRARETAEPLARQKSLDVSIEPGVAEFDQHASEYVPVEKLRELDYERWRRLMAGEVDADFDGFALGVIDAMNEICAANRGARVAVACHGGVINVWAAHVLGMQPRLFFNPGYTSLNRFMVASSGEKTVITLNELAHLR